VHDNGLADLPQTGNPKGYRLVIDWHGAPRRHSKPPPENSMHALTSQTIPEVHFLSVVSVPHSGCRFLDDYFQALFLHLEGS
jgi:hypothetical protein